MKILFVSKSPKQTVITIQKAIDDYEVHLYNHYSGYTEMWTTAKDHEGATYFHKQLCMKCYIDTNM